MPIVGNPLTFDRKFAFKFVIEGFLSANFTKVGPLSSKVGVVKYREGGRLIPHKSPGLLDFEPLTCERGAMALDVDAYAWMVMTANASSNIGLKDSLVKRNGSILQLDRDGQILKTYAVFGAFPTEFTAAEWDASANEVVISKLVLEYDYFTLVG